MQKSRCLRNDHSHGHTVASSAGGRVRVLALAHGAPYGGYEVVARALAVVDQAVAKRYRRSDRKDTSQFPSLCVETSCCCCNATPSVVPQTDWRTNSPLTGFRDTDTRTLEVLFQALVVLCESAQLELRHGLLVRLDVHRGGGCVYGRVLRRECGLSRFGSMPSELR